MRIILLEPANPDFSGQLSNPLAGTLADALNLPLILPTEQHDPETGLLSDDRIIQTMVDSMNDETKHLQLSPSSSYQSEFLITQYPHTVIQAQSLDIALSQIGLPVNSVLVMKSTISPQNRENKALIRYYRTQNKLILLEDALSVDEICKEIRLSYAKRRSGSPANTDEP